MTASQLRDLVERLIAAGQWHPGDPAVWIVADAGYDVMRLSYLLRDLPVEILGRLRSDRVMRRPAPTRAEFAAANPAGGRPPKHGSEFIFKDSRTWGAPDAETKAETTRYDTAHAQSWDRSTPDSNSVPLGGTTPANSRSSRAPSSASRSTTCPAAATPSRCGCGGHD